VAERASERFVRLVGLVSYLETSGPVPVDDLARRFGVTPKQILTDVDTLWISGTPGYWPEDLIDFDADSYDRGVVHLTESRGMTHPLRLGTRETIALVAALRALREVVAAGGDTEQTAVVDSALTKLTAATGEATNALDVRLTVDAAPHVMTAVRTALQNRTRLRIDYVNASDITSTRTVEPIRLLPSDDHTYLHAWCTDAQGERTFRTDRILTATALDDPVAPTTSDRPAPPTYRPQGHTARIVLSSRARWVAEQIPVETTENLPDGDFAITVRVANPTWLRHLLLRHAPDVRSVDPPDLAHDVTTTARRALDAYTHPHDA